MKLNKTEKHVRYESKKKVQNINNWNKIEIEVESVQFWRVAVYPALVSVLLLTKHY